MQFGDLGVHAATMTRWSNEVGESTRTHVRKQWSTKQTTRM